MATKKKLLQAAAGQAGGEALNVEDVFSTYLYDGNATARSIVNGIDLAGEGGLVWIKARGAAYDNVLFDTERGANQWIRSNNTGASATYYSNTGLTSFNSDGFSLGTDPTGYYVNQSAGGGYASWTFRKAPKFFDVVTYTGTGTDQLIPHNLGCVPGFVVVKKTSATGYWSAWHRSFTNNEYILLDLTNAAVATSNVRTVTDTHYEVHGNYPDENQSGATYVAYLFAHNDGDGEFGDGTQDIIKCGSFNSDPVSGSVFVDVDLGFEPQFFMWKPVGGSNPTGDWVVYDTMRGFVNATSGNGDARLRWNSANAEQAYNNTGHPTATGVSMRTGAYNTQYIYIAIRRGPMAVPESATDVFAMDTGANSTPSFDAGFPVDASLVGRVDSTDKWYFTPRLTGSNYLNTASTAAQSSSPAFGGWDYQTQYYDGILPSTYQAWMWKRAPSFFDVVAYTGTGVARTVSHNLGVAPEMMWVKCRSASSSWPVYHKDIPLNKLLWVDLSSAEAGPYSPGAWNGSAPTDIEFTVSSSGWGTNDSGSTYIAYLFASLDGVSKVGSYTGNGSSQTIDCGFSTGARFVLIKITSSAGQWWVWDTERGIVSGVDPALALNLTNAEDSSYDSVGPHNSGFIVNNTLGAAINTTGETYIFYAIA